MKTRTPAIVGAVFAAAMSMSACGGGSDNSSASGKASTVAASASSNAAPSSTPASSSAPATKTVTAAPPATHTVTEKAPTPMRHAAQAAPAGATCHSEHDYSVIAVSHASCGFANNVGERAYNDLFKGGQSGPDTFMAYSPATGQSYKMTCTIAPEDGEISCSGGNNAQVAVSPNTGF